MYPRGSSYPFSRLLKAICVRIEQEDVSDFDLNLERSAKSGLHMPTRFADDVLLGILES